MKEWFSWKQKKIRLLKLKRRNVYLKLLQKNKAKVLKNLGGKMLFMIGSFGKHLKNTFESTKK